MNRNFHLFNKDFIYCMEVSERLINVFGHIWEFFLSFILPKFPVFYINFIKRSQHIWKCNWNTFKTMCSLTPREVSILLGAATPYKEMNLHQKSSPWDQNLLGKYFRWTVINGPPFIQRSYTACKIKLSNNRFHIYSLQVDIRIAFSLCFFRWKIQVLM